MHRILCLQHSSVFETHGGVEYYLHDVLNEAAGIYGTENIHTIVPKRKRAAFSKSVSYQVYPLKFASSKLIAKLQNRLHPGYFSLAQEIIRKEKITLLLCAHVSLGPVCYALSKIFHIPYITCLYGIEAWGNLQPQDEFALSRADHLVSISEWTKNILVNRGYDPEKIDILTPILDPRFETEFKLEKIPSEKFRMVSISRLDAREQYKGQDHVLQALALLKKENREMKIQYRIVGDGDDKARLQKLSNELGLDTWVQFAPGVKDRAELITQYAQCDLYIMPSRFGRWDGKWRGEGFGIVFVEAACLEIPSIAYDCGGATDIIINEKTGYLIPQDNIPALAEKIKYLYSNREQLEQLGKTARTHIFSRFTSKQMHAQLVQAFSI